MGYVKAVYQQLTSPDNASVVRSIAMFGVSYLLRSTNAPCWPKEHLSSWVLRRAILPDGAVALDTLCLSSYV